MRMKGSTTTLRARNIVHTWAQHGTYLGATWYVLAIMMIQCYGSIVRSIFK